MKKIICFMFLVVFSLTLVSCGNNESNEPSDKPIVTAAYVAKDANGNLYEHKHDVADETNPEIYEIVDGETVLKENKVDKDKLVMAIKNLVINAIVHSPENSKIYINLENKTLEIINTGINIPREDMENIFKPFYRIDKSRTKNDDFGNGLGLYITNEIITKHDFFLGVENVENGVKFYIIFE